MDFDDNSIRRYLLGKAPADLAARVEERYIGDAEFFGRVEALEMELCRDFASGALSGAERQQFLNRYQSSPRLRERLAEELALTDALRARALDRVPDAVPLRRPEGRGWRRGEFAIYGLAMASAAAVVAGVVTWKGHHAAGGLLPGGKTAAPGEVTFRVEPGVRKGGGSGPGRLLLPSTAGRVRLLLGLPGGPEFSRFRVEIVRLEAGGEARVAEYPNLTASAAPPGWAVVVLQPAVALPDGDYIVRMQGADANGGLHDQPSYFLSVVR